MGSVESYDTKSGRRWRARWRDPSHKSVEKWGFKTKRDAELHVSKSEVDKASGEYVDPVLARVTVGERAKPWLVGKEAALKPSAYRPLEITWRLHVGPRWGQTPLRAVQHSDVQDWVAELSTRRSATVTLRAYGILAGILDVAVRDRRLPRNVARDVDLPRKKRKAHIYLTHEQVHALACEAGQYKTLVGVLAYTGIRWGEAVGLKVGGVDFLRRRIQVDENAVSVGGEIFVGTPKSHKRRSAPFPDFLAIPLAKLCEGKTREQLVFGDGHNFILTPAHRDGWFAYARTRAKVPAALTIHDLRHTAASLAISAGANVKAVQRMLGHASAAMTLDIYADLFDDDLDAVSKALNDAVANSSVGFLWGKA
jgi:integrase